MNQFTAHTRSELGMSDGAMLIVATDELVPQLGMGWLVVGVGQHRIIFAQSILATSYAEIQH